MKQITSLDKASSTQVRQITFDVDSIAAVNAFALDRISGGKHMDAGMRAQMAEQNGTHLVRGLLAGMAGGLVASWIMNVFMEQAGPKIIDAVQSVQGGKDSQPHKKSAKGKSHDDAPKEDATMKAADAIVSTVTGGRHLSMEEKQKSGPVVHYAFGALMGGLYGGLAEYSSVPRTGFGTLFAGLLFAGADLVAVPALNLSESSADAPASSLATPFAAHLVYGVATESVRRIVRAAL